MFVDWLHLGGGGGSKPGVTWATKMEDEIYELYFYDVELSS